MNLTSTVWSRLIFQNSEGTKTKNDQIKVQDLNPKLTYSTGTSSKI